MKHYMLLATVADRFTMVKALCASIRAYVPNWQVIAVVQEYDMTMARELQATLPGAVIITLPKRVGPHLAKMKGLQYIENLHTGRDDEYVVNSIDDDMEFLPQTNLFPAVVKCLQPRYGFVSCGWVASEAFLAKKVVRDTFIEQAIVYTGGSMLFSRKIAKVLLEVPMLDYFSDNTQWSLEAYIRGFINVRYLGSVAIHRVCGPGGRKAWAAQSKRAIPDPELLMMATGKTPKDINNLLIGRSEDLTVKAKALHRANRKG